MDRVTSQQWSWVHATVSPYLHIRYICAYSYFANLRPGPDKQMGISDTVAIVACSLCNILEFLCFVVIISEMSKHHVTHVRLFLSKVAKLSPTAV